MSVIHLRRGVGTIFKRVIKLDADVWLSETVATVAVPLSFYLAFGLGLQGYIRDIEGVPYLVFIAPGLIALTILLEAFRCGAWNVWVARWNTKIINEFRVKPITTYDIIVGEILGGFVLAIIKGVIVAVCLYAMAPIGFSFHHWGVYLLYMFPGSVLFTCVGTAVGTTMRRPDQIAKVQTIVITPLLYLGGLFFPASIFPQWLQPLVQWLPTTALLDGGRRAFLHGTFAWPELALLWGVAGAAFFGAAVLFNRKLSQ